MTLADILQSGVSVANTITKNGELQVSFTHEPVASALGSNGQPTYGTAVTKTGVWVKRQRRVLAAGGNDRASTSQLTVMDRTVFGERDRITIAGEVRPILRIDAAYGEDGLPFMTEIWFG